MSVVTSSSKSIAGSGLVVGRFYRVCRFQAHDLQSLTVS